ncbi:MAG: formate dehydrogenase-N subunit alpha, partial [Pseudomonadota bacterium]|nr:formate dehydrogenase-N subunit alpha [Pseudomonadota bacterium]
TDLAIIMGGNAAEAHTCGFKWVTEALENRKARLIVVDPRFTRSAAIADLYAPIRVGTDIAFLGGVINYLLANNKIHQDYVKAYTNASFLIKDEFAFDDGYFSGYDTGKRTYEKSSWGYQIGADGFAMVDETLENPRCVYQLMKTHFSRYTPDVVNNICGTPKETFLKVCDMIGSTATPARVMTILYALGWTQHTVGSQNIRTMAMIQLLLGNMGRAGGGVNALRGHANVQGITDMCAYSEVLPGYLSAPTDADDTREKYNAARTPKPLRPNQMNFPQNFAKWHVSLQKAWFGDNATKENEFAYDLTPKRDGAYDVLAIFERMYQGRVNGLIAQGFNPLAALPNKKKLGAAMSQLKFLVIMDPLRTETGEFWKNFGDENNVKPEDIKTEVIRLPSTCFAEDAGSFTSSGRVIQWHWAATDPPGEAKTDREILATLFTKLREMYATDGGKFPEALQKVTWNYANPIAPSSEELLREISGRALIDVVDPKDKTKTLLKGGEQLAGFGVLQDDGSTACGNWLYAGSWSQAGNLTARRDTNDPGNLGNNLTWGFSWPANRRVLYNRAGADPSGKPWDAKRGGIRWDGAKWAGIDVPDMAPALGPDSGAGPFIMTNEGVARLFAPALNEGPFPEHYEPFETPIGTNPLHAKVVSNPVARVFKGDLESFGKPDQFPYAATTYRLTEHFHFWTKNVESSAIVQPSPFVEIGEKLAKAKGIANGDLVKVSSNRGELKAKAVVTRRVADLTCNGKEIYTVGIPIHWGFVGVAKTGYLANTLTPYVADANSQTPEFKAFLVNIEKA